MTFFDDIVSAQSCIIQPFASKVILVRSPLTIAQQVNPPADKLWLFDPTHYDATDTNDYVYLRIFPNYTPEDDIVGDRTLRNTFNGSAIAPSRVRRGFNADIIQSNAFIYDLIERLVHISLTSSFSQYSPIKIIDFARPNLFGANTVVNSVGERGSILYGSITLNQLPHLVRVANGRDYIRGGWSMRFQSLELSIV